jgi:glycosyltransferase involved in cell wall biosynthesis
MLQRPLVSVIIPTYNRAYLVTDAIDSVLNQTYKNFELLVVDDYSTDNTKDVVETYSDSRIKYLINTRKKGAQGARNTGLYAANGEWVAMLDSDDAWLPEKLEKQLDLPAKADEDLAGVSCGFALFNFRMNKIMQKRYPQKRLFTKNDLLYKNYIGGFSVFIFKRNVGLKIGGFDERFSSRQDIDFYLSIIDEGNIDVVNEILVYNRYKNEDKISKDFTKKIESIIIFCKKYSEQIDKSYLLKSHYKNTLFFFYALNKETELFKYIFWPIQGLFTEPIYTFNQFKNMIKYFVKNGLMKIKIIRNMFDIYT